MGQIRMTAEIRTDYDCETGGIPAKGGRKLFSTSIPPALQ